MKLTKSTLRQLIKEELLNEFDPLNLYPDQPSLSFDKHETVIGRATANEEREKEMQRLALSIDNQLKDLGGTYPELIRFLYALGRADMDADVRGVDTKDI